MIQRLSSWLSILLLSASMVTLAQAQTPATASAQASVAQRAFWLGKKAKAQAITLISKPPCRLISTCFHILCSLLVVCMQAAKPER